MLEDKIQEAVWQTVLRGRRPPSAQWPRDNRSSTKANGSPNRRRSFSLVRPPPHSSGDEGPRTSSFRTNQRHPCVHWSEVEAGGRGAAGQRQGQNSPHGSCCSARRTRTTQIGRTLQRASPFSVLPVLIVPDVQAEVARMQGIMDRLQEELAMIRSGRVSETVEDADDEEMVAGLPQEVSSWAQHTSRSQWWSGARNTALPSQEGTRARPSEG